MLIAWISGCATAFVQKFLSCISLTAKHLMNSRYNCCKNQNRLSNYFASEGIDATDKSLLSSITMRMVDPKEVWKIPKGQVPICPQSRVIGILLEVLPSTKKMNDGISTCDFVHREIYWWVEYTENSSQNIFFSYRY